MSKRGTTRTPKRKAAAGSWWSYARNSGDAAGILDSMKDGREYASGASTKAYECTVTAWASTIGSDSLG